MTGRAMMVGGNDSSSKPTGLWVGEQVALFNHRCPALSFAPAARSPTPTPARSLMRTPPSREFFVSAPCIVFVLRGAFKTSSALGSHLADTATVVFRNARAGYGVRDVPGVPHEATTLRVSPGALRMILVGLGHPAEAEAEHLSFALGSAPSDARAVLLHKALRRSLARASAPADLELEEAVLRLAALGVAGAFGSPTHKPSTPDARECVVAAKEYLATHATLRLRLSDVAAASGCTEWHLARSFRAMTGTTIHAHLTRLRLGLALDGVLNDRQDLTRVAMAAGFADHSHFTLAFRREFGMTPTAARGMSLRSLMECP